MKYKIEELKDITDSREIMQSKPQGFSRYMMYIIIAVLVLVLVWSLIATKEICVKANGVVVPKKETTKISSTLNGKVTTNNVTEGMKVKKGDILLSIDGEEYELQKKSLDDSLKNKEKELEANKKLKNSILDEKNYLDSSDSVESNYSKMYDLYIQNIKTGNAQVEAVDIQKDNIKKTISDLNILIKCYKEEKNYFDTSNYLYYQYSDYEMTLKNYRDQITSYKEKINVLQGSKTEENKDSIEAQIEELQKGIDSINSEIEKFKNTSIMNITSTIAENESKLKESVATSSSGSYKEQYISQLDSTISSLESTISDIKMNLDMTNEKIDETTIKAQYDGVITLLNEVKVGDYIQAGTQIASIVPENSKEYKAQIYIANQDFGEINEGEDVILEFVSLPQSEYGIVKTNIKEISVDAKVSEKQGTSYYTGECTIPLTSMKNKKGATVDIKNGMLVQARIINREVSYFRYFLEKINILDE